MAWTLEVAADKNATTWDDRTGVVERSTLRVGGIANRTEIDTGSGFDLDNDAGTVTLPARRVVRVIEDATTTPTTLFRGRIINNTKARGSNLTGDANQFDVNMVDENADFGGIPVSRVTRPAETDVERVQYVLSTWLQGFRASTNLADTYLLATDPVSLPTKRYEDTTPQGILADIIAEAGKECFITVDHELFYGPADATDYAAGLSITDVSPNGTTSFGPIEPSADEDGTEFFSGVKVVYKGRAFVYVTRATAETDHDMWRTTIIDEEIATEAAATARANLFLDEFDHVEDRYRCKLLLQNDQVDLIKKGQTVSFRSAACGVLTPVTLRVKRLSWEEASPSSWFAHLELGFPAKLAPRVGPGGIGAGGGGGGGDIGGQDCADCGPFDPTPDGGCGPLIDSTDHTLADWTVIVMDGASVVDNTVHGTWTEEETEAIHVELLLGIDVPRDIVSAGMSALLTWSYQDSSTNAGDNVNGWWMNPRPFVELKISGNGAEARAQAEEMGDFGVPAAAGNWEFWGTLNSTTTVVPKDEAWGRNTMHWLKASVSETEYSASSIVDTVSDAYTLPAGFDVDGVQYVTATIKIGIADMGILGNEVITDPNAGSITLHNMTLQDANGDELFFWCPEGTPSYGQSVSETVGTGDDVTTGFVTDYPYRPGTLKVWLNDAREFGITETDPSTGDFDFDDAPFTGEVIRAEYQGG